MAPTIAKLRPMSTSHCINVTEGASQMPELSVDGQMDSTVLYFGKLNLSCHENGSASEFSKHFLMLPLYPITDCTFAPQTF